MTGLQPPRATGKLVPVFTSAELTRLEQACAGRTFAQRRDAAIIAVFRATGIRLAELAGIRSDPDDPRRSDTGVWQREITVGGVGNKGPMTASGIYQIIARRGRQCGVDVYPHQFRHHFSHTWLDRGGPGGDLIRVQPGMRRGCVAR